MEKLRDKAEVLKRIKQELNVEFMFVIVLKILNEQGPAVYFDLPFIQFASEIGSQISVDYYYLPED